MRYICYYIYIQISERMAKISADRSVIICSIKMCIRDRHDPVTTTDELIPSGETSSFRSNPLGLAEFALSRKYPAYVGRAKDVYKRQILM